MRDSTHCDHRRHLALTDVHSRKPRFLLAGSARSSRVAPPQPAVYDLERKQHLCSSSLECIIPTWPAVKQATLYEKRVAEDCDRSGPRHQADLVVSPQRPGRSIEQVFGLLPDI